jgi:serine/threonine-protein kinase
MTHDGNSITRGGTVAPEHVARVRAIFEAAVERRPSERRAFAEGACGNDPGLLREVLGLLAADEAADPLLDPPAARPPSSAPEEGRFPAGTVLAGRYRVLGLLGKGGMGEVYRAHDQILNQTVALKFLAPAHLSEAALVRFRNEVRIARQVSHPNVCRVYDLGMVEGLHFLSMEYIDGEDLASLLRRIGRLPQDKAIEFTRKICAGLAAAHERGVLHRDLKPANIMIDGRGQPRITDFGLAGLAQEIPLSDLRSGTPAYMSPEQTAGRDVTTRSDIYSLGLVLHEMFTGKTRRDTQSTPSELVKDLDPAIERLILRCLEDEPKRRPSSALSVAMALPGADPIAAALAAGETPSPEMVAASQEKEGLAPGTAVFCFAAIVIGVVVILLFPATARFERTARLDLPPDALAFRAQEILKQLGYADRPRTTAYGFECCDANVLRQANELDANRRDAILASHQPAIVSFWYRQHRDRILAEPESFVRASMSYDSPPNTEPGMVRLQLDPTGRLIAFEARPTAIEGQPTDTPDVVWAKLFSAAGLDPARFATSTPTRLPAMPFDARHSWVGVYAPDRSEPVHAEAAAWQGRPVYFFIQFGQEPQVRTGRSAPRPVLVFAVSVLLAGGVSAVLLARHNLRAGRGDRKGAARIAAFAMACAMCSWVIRASHVPTGWEVRLVLGAIALFGLTSALLWLGYVAVEPYMRRYWPESLISWNRLQSGTVDSLVASHILVGITTWMVTRAVINGLLQLMPIRAPLNVSALDSPADFASFLMRVPYQTMQTTILFLVVVVVLRMLTRRRIWIADLLACLVFVQLGAPLDFSTPYYFALSASFNVASGFVLLWLIRRFGFAAVVAAFMGRLLVTPLSLGTWYTGYSLVALLIPVGIAAWALWVIVSDARTTNSQVALAHPG